MKNDNDLVFLNQQFLNDMDPSQLVKMDLNEKSLTKQKTIQTFKIDTQGFRITMK